MRRFVCLQRSTARLVVLVMLAAVLFPALGHAFVTDKAAALGWMEVCTTGGVEVRSVALEGEAPAKPSLLIEHCPYCLVSSFDDAARPVVASPVFSAADGAVMPIGASSPRNAAALLSAALPRAPPAGR